VKTLSILSGTLVVALLPLCAQTVSRDGAFEKLALVSATDPRTWAPAESSAEPSTVHTKVGGASWRWHIDVDYFAGEAKYPIGWPRIAHPIPEGKLRDWSGWDFLHAWIYVETSRDALPKDPVNLGLHTPDRASGYNRSLGELAKDRWVELKLPISQIPRNHDVRHLQFNIAESNYKHGDRLDVYVNDLALVRHAEATLFDLRAEHSVLFSDARRLPVSYQLLGVKPEERVDVACELRRAGSVVARAAASSSRGAQRVVLQFAAPALPAGNYELHASIGGRPQAATAAVRVVDSPWKQP
jgi:hypothetical protein